MTFGNLPTSLQKSQSGIVPLFCCTNMFYSPMDGEVGKRLVESSAGRLPHLQCPTHMSLGSSHTNAILLAIRDGCLTNEQALSPRLHREAKPDDMHMFPIDNRSLFAESPGLKEAATRGLKWLVLSHQVREIWGNDILMFVCKALNFDAREPVSELEVIA